MSDDLAEIVIRPATPEDAERAKSAFPDVLPDKWREGQNRRSFVAVDAGGEVLGHCRGLDNEVHPGSRVLVFESAPAIKGTKVERELLEAQVEVSTVPLHDRVKGDDDSYLALLESVGAKVMQLMPPWEREVNAELREWAEGVLADDGAGREVVPATEVSWEAYLELDAEHYIAQHESWSPAAIRDDLVELLRHDHQPGTPAKPNKRRWNEDRSLALLRDGDLIAAAFVWGDPAADDEPEVTISSNPYSSPEAWWAKQRLIAELVDRADDGDRLLIDSHLSMDEEYALIGDLPGLVDPEDEGWTAIIAVPNNGGTVKSTFEEDEIPESAAWARRFAEDS